VQHGPAPVAILYQAPYLVVSIRAALDDAQMVLFHRELTKAIDDRKARGVLIDVAALDVIDSFGSRNICEIAEIARLRGVSAVIVGVEPNLAYSMVHLGITTSDIQTALDLTDGLEVIDHVAGAERSQGGLATRQAKPVPPDRNQG
jgi:rsbT antagonist protein RsbS